MNRCSQHVSRTRDGKSVEVSDSAAAGPLRAASFPAGATAKCKCASQHSPSSGCDELWVFNAGGLKIATFHGDGFRAMDEQNGSGLTIYRLPKSSTTNTRTQDQDESRGLTLVGPTLAETNEANARFWKRKDEEETR